MNNDNNGQYKEWDQIENAGKQVTKHVAAAAAEWNAYIMHRIRAWCMQCSGASPYLYGDVIFSLLFVQFVLL